MPSPRSFHTTFVCGDTAILFGGLRDSVQNVKNDLYTLDMVDFR